MSSKIIEGDVRAATLKAVVWYDDFKLAVNAKVMLEHAASDVGAEAKWSIRPWRLDMLNRKAASDEALAEAVTADLILVAAATTRAVPDCLKHWLESWVMCCRVSNAALGALFTPPGGPTMPPLVAKLKQFAKRHELTFLFNQDVLARVHLNHSDRKELKHEFTDRKSVPTPAVRYSHRRHGRVSTLNATRFMNVENRKGQGKHETAFEPDGISPGQRRTNKK